MKKPNSNCTCYYFDDTIKSKDFHFDNILLDKKPFGNILIYDICWITLITAKPIHTMFSKVNGLIRDYDQTKLKI